MVQRRGEPYQVTEVGQVTEGLVNLAILQAEAAFGRGKSVTLGWAYGEHLRGQIKAINWPGLRLSAR